MNSISHGDKLHALESYCMEHPELLSLWAGIQEIRRIRRERPVLDSSSAMLLERMYEIYIGGRR